MTVRCFSRSTNIFRKVARQFFTNETPTQPTWTRSISLMMQSRPGNPKFHHNALVGTSLGFLGFLFNAKDDPEEEPEIIMTIKRSILLIQV